MRLLALTLCLPAILQAQDALEIVWRASDIDRRNNEMERNYTYLQRQEERAQRVPRTAISSRLRPASQVNSATRRIGISAAVSGSSSDRTMRLLRS